MKLKLPNGLSVYLWETEVIKVQLQDNKLVLTRPSGKDLEITFPAMTRQLDLPSTPLEPLIKGPKLEDLTSPQPSETSTTCTSEALITPQKSDERQLKKIAYEMDSALLLADLNRLKALTQSLESQQLKAEEKIAILERSMTESEDLKRVEALTQSLESLESEQLHTEERITLLERSINDSFRQIQAPIKAFLTMNATMMNAPTSGKSNMAFSEPGYPGPGPGSGKSGNQKGK